MKLSNKAVILLILSFISHPYKSWSESSADHANIAAENLIERDELTIDDNMSESDNKDSTESSQDFIWGRIEQSSTSPATITETSTQLDITQGKLEKALKNKNYDEADKLSKELEVLRSIYKNLAESSKEKFYAITSTRFNHAETIPLTKYRIDNVITHLENQAKSSSTGETERKQITNEINTLKDIKQQFKINPETLTTAQEYYAQGAGDKNANKLKDKEAAIKVLTSYKELGESTKKLNKAIKKENEAETTKALLANDKASEKFLSSVKEFNKYIDVSERNKRKDDFRLKQQQNAITKAQSNNIKITEQNKILDQTERQQRIQNYREQQNEIQKNIEATKQNKALDQTERQQKIQNYREQQKEIQKNIEITKQNKILDQVERQLRIKNYREQQNEIQKNIEITKQNKILDQAEKKQRIQNYREQQKEIQRNIEITKQNKILDQAERQQRIKNYREQQKERKKEQKVINRNSTNITKISTRKHRHPSHITLKKIHLESLIAKSNMALGE